MGAARAAHGILPRTSSRSRAPPATCNVQEDREAILTATLLLYSATVFVGATLLFVVQPMVGKMILPLLGGAPAVWTTCMVFFQTALLAGYAYAHASTAWLRVPRQMAVHVTLLAVAWLVLPIDVNRTVVLAGDADPVPRLLLGLAISVGLPFLVISATAPLLQTWFTYTGHPSSHDPYFLYAASNLGSMLALLAYPAVIEPHLHVRGSGWLSQTLLWSLGYLVLAAFTFACALIVWRCTSRSPRPRQPERTPADAEAMIASPSTRAVDPGVEDDTPAALVAHSGATDGTPAVVESSDGWNETLTHRRRLRWIVLAFVPSSLFIGVTSYISTDIAAVPLLWVIPLAVYLSSFIVTFGPWPARGHRVVVTLALPAVLVVMFLTLSGYSQRIAITVLEHFLLLLGIALACHGELALDRPAPRRLTEFYLLISLGGVLGGVFNALVAPLVFDSLAEYPLVIALAGVVAGCPSAAARRSRRALVRDVVAALGVGVLALLLYSNALAVGVHFAALLRVFRLPMAWVHRLGTVETVADKVIGYGPPLLAILVLRRRRLAVGVALALVLLVARFSGVPESPGIHQARSFFGVLRVSRDEDDGTIELHHGTTLHGAQSVDPARRREPLTYYHRGSPIGQVFEDPNHRVHARRVAVIGLGTGTIAAYARRGDTMTFYEIDRLVRDIASEYFTYLRDARGRGATVRVDLGDARVRLEAVKRERPGERYDVIVVDAFTSDAIPIHLITREAFALYRGLLVPDGLIAVHISNRNLRLAPVVANLADDAGLTALLREDNDAEPVGAAASTWAVLARMPESLGELARDDRWEELEPDRAVGTWTDDFHNVLSILKWR